MLEIASALATLARDGRSSFSARPPRRDDARAWPRTSRPRRADGTLGAIRAAIDLDMFGVGGKLKLVELGLWPDTEPIPHTEWLMRPSRGASPDELGYDVGRMTAPWGVAESGRFIEAGRARGLVLEAGRLLLPLGPRHGGQARRELR